MISPYGLTMMSSKHRFVIHSLLTLLTLALLAYIFVCWIPDSLAKFIYTAHNLPVTFKS